MPENRAQCGTDDIHSIARFHRLMSISTVTSFDAKRALLRQPDMFHRFRVTDDHVSLQQAALKPTTQLLVFQRNGQRRALMREQMVYHHVAQGEIAGEPFLVTF